MEGRETGAGGVGGSVQRPERDGGKLGCELTSDRKST